MAEPNAESMIVTLQAMITHKLEQLQTAPGFVPGVSLDDELEAFWSAALDMCENQVSRLLRGPAAAAAAAGSVANSGTSHLLLSLPLSASVDVFAR